VKDMVMLYLKIKLVKAITDLTRALADLIRTIKTRNFQP